MKQSTQCNAREQQEGWLGYGSRFQHLPAYYLSALKSRYFVPHNYDVAVLGLYA